MTFESYNFLTWHFTEGNVEPCPFIASHNDSLGTAFRTHCMAFSIQWFVFYGQFALLYANDIAIYALLSSLKSQYYNLVYMHVYVQAMINGHI